MSENKKHYAKKSETKRGILISRKPKKRSSQTKNKNLPTEQVLHLQRTIGNRAVNRLIQSGTIQAKLTVGKPNSIYEKEADRVADRVMSMPEGSPVQRESAGEEEKEGVQSKPLAEQITPLIRRQAEEEEKAQTKPLLQRQEAEEEEAQTKPLIQRQAEEEEKPAQTKLLQRQEGEEEKEAQTKLQRQAEEEEKQAQPKAAPGGTPKVTPNIESNINSMRGGGQPLSESTRSFFEPRFGADFSHVRLHTGTNAAQTAQSINARAFTTGKDIVFNSGQYSPGTSSGNHLLAHELTHVIQQKKGIDLALNMKNKTTQKREDEVIRKEFEKNSIKLKKIFKNIKTCISCAKDLIKDINDNKEFYEWEERNKVREAGNKISTLESEVKDLNKRFKKVRTTGDQQTIYNELKKIKNALVAIIKELNEISIEKKCSCTFR